MLNKIKKFLMIFGAVCLIAGIGFSIWFGYIKFTQFQDMQARKATIIQFITEYNKKDFTSMYNMTSGEFKTAMTDGQNKDLLTRIYNKLGKYKSNGKLEPLVSQILIENVSEYQIKTSFEKDKDGMIFFRLKKSGKNKYEIFSYYFKSKELVSF